MTKPGLILAEIADDIHIGYSPQQILRFGRIGAILGKHEVCTHTRDNPARIAYGELACNVDHISDSRRELPHSLLVWPITDNAEAITCLEDVKNGCGRRQLGRLAVERHLVATDFTDPNVMAFAASDEAGVARSIAIGGRHATINPEDRYVLYNVSIDMLFTASRHRKKCLGAAAILPIAFHIANDIQAFAERFAKGRQHYKLQPMLSADFESKRGERACISLLNAMRFSIETTKDLFPKFDCEDPIPEMGW